MFIKGVDDLKEKLRSVIAIFIELTGTICKSINVYEMFIMAKSYPYPSIRLFSLSVV